MSKAPTPDALEAELDPAPRALVRHMRAFVKKQAPQLKETMKWGGVCWVGNWNVCYAHAVGAEVYFGFIQGSSLKDPKKVLEGEGKFVRSVKVRKASEFPKTELAKLLKQAIALDA